MLSTTEFGCDRTLPFCGIPHQLHYPFILSSTWYFRDPSGSSAFGCGATENCTGLPMPRPALRILSYVRTCKTISNLTVSLVSGPPHTHVYVRLPSHLLLVGSTFLDLKPIELPAEFESHGMLFLFCFHFSIFLSSTYLLPHHSQKTLYIYHRGLKKTYLDNYCRFLRPSSHSRIDIVCCMTPTALFRSLI
ncbi:unnamed protein product [Protopolystoma xenopodis]|uniref:Uncharacterized protein n=1 Tax=Protopolystoma xenopodis TaxID=117903 RepID=A0A3S5AX06_9PLAT|nr:unnamed protein product [Protopolystoma xenopodis]